MTRASTFRTRLRSGSWAPCCFFGDCRRHKPVTRSAFNYELNRGPQEISANRRIGLLRALQPTPPEWSTAKTKPRQKLVRSRHENQSRNALRLGKVSNQILHTTYPSSSPPRCSFLQGLAGGYPRAILGISIEAENGHFSMQSPGCLAILVCQVVGISLETENNHLAISKEMSQVHHQVARSL